MDIKEYVKQMEVSLHKNRKSNGSKVEVEIKEMVIKMIEAGEATTIKAITEKLGKVKNYGSYVRTIVLKSNILKFEKVNGICLILIK